ncbi:hypothetical protein ECDEC15E_4505 [Escherichia coli DEC15E]|nr:hypothetical protein ECDEC15E_4505 [Escherichia coli DEC15E]
MQQVEAYTTPRNDYYTNAEKEKTHLHQVHHNIYSTDALIFHK